MMNKLIKMLLDSTMGSFVQFGPTRRTVDSALVHFNKAIDELKVVSEQQHAEALRQDKISADAKEASKAAWSESERAINVISKINSLLA